MRIQKKEGRLSAAEMKENEVWFGHEPAEFVPRLLGFSPLRTWKWFRSHNKLMGLLLLQQEGKVFGDVKSYL